MRAGVRSTSLRVRQSEMTPIPSPVLVTVLTATYNRRHTLPRLYESLFHQTRHDFEWLIIDDGSTDGTRELVERWQRECGAFPIRYSWKPNGGKHTALNLGVGLVSGAYCCMVDSDDWLAPHCLQTLIAQWDALPPSSRSQFANVEALCAFEDGTLIGSRFPDDVFDSDNFAISQQRAKDADTKGMYRTEVLREFPFPEPPGTRFVVEALVWNRVAQKYRTRFVNVVVAYNEYRADGLSQRTTRSRIRDSTSSLQCYTEILQMPRPLPTRTKIRSAANYTRLSLHQRIGLLALLRNAPRRAWVVATSGLGFGLYLADLWRSGREDAECARAAGHSELAG
jgi:glycosyltransferase involved in cell wall biosynthesis